MLYHLAQEFKSTMSSIKIRSSSALQLPLHAVFEIETASTIQQCVLLMLVTTYVIQTNKKLAYSCLGLFSISEVQSLKQKNICSRNDLLLFKIPLALPSDHVMCQWS
ncbi:hypothetical protein PanWU01x14_362310 [Parasponia andersonii]|uniref:Uncharacterized protein n=1 Tax=Parasponia andersonii TaxID=3476 RepID=A0A2P5A6Z7_PARAD|nr:hypothetical protein PanWU01x14_362310 [Parasponia andersonii]